MRCATLLPLLCLLFFIELVAAGKPDGGKSDSDDEQKSGSTPKNAEKRRQGKWRPRERTVGWGSNRRGGALRIKDGDRKKPARDRLEWTKWRKARGARRSYRNTTHEELHARIFEETEAMVAENQAAFASGEASYELEINEFADYTEDEIAQLGIGEIGLKAAMELDSSVNDTSAFEEPQSRAKRSPSSIDWRLYGKVGAVKNQGSCGSCYAFSAVGAIESRVAIKRNVNVLLSEQHVVDCTGKYGNAGCAGGWMWNVFKYVKEASGGLVKEKDYAYQAKMNSCPALPQGVAESKLAGHVLIPKGDEKALQDAVGTTGPVCIAMNFGRQDIQAYKSGVYDNYAGCGNAPTHAVLVVGYGTENGVDYFILRNSWGASWGDKGYIRVRRGVNLCGLADWASYPIIA